MATKSSTSTGTTSGPSPYTSPMNLTCVTKTATATTTAPTGTAAGNPPTQLIVMIRTDGVAPPGPPPNQGWNPYIPADPSIQYTLTLNGGDHVISGAGVAVFGKNS